MKKYLPKVTLLTKTIGFLGAGLLMLVNPETAGAQQCDRVVAVNGQDASEALNAVDFTDVNTGITVGSGGRILSTTDGGTNWIVRNSGTRESLLDLQMLSGQVAYAVGGNGTVLKTIDGGINWIKIPAFTTNLLRTVSFTHPDTGVVAGNSGTIFRTTNGGATWLSGSSGVSNTETLVDMVFPSSLIGYIVSSTSLLLKTTNGGQTWASVGPATTYNYTSIAALSPTHIIMGRGETNIMATSTTGGTTLGSEFLNVVGARVHKMHLLNANVGYAVGNNARIYKRTNGTWTVINNTLGSFNDVKFLNPSVGYVVGHGLIYKTTSGGSTWVRQNPAPDNGYRSLFFLDRNNGYLGGYSGKLHKTTDGGQTLTTTTLSTTANLQSVHFTNPTTGFVAANNIIFKTVNSGTNWTTFTIPSTLPNVYANFEFTSGTTGYLGVSSSSQGGLLKTTNGGTTWTLLAQRFIGATQKVQFISADTGFVASSSGGNGSIYRTADAGTTWTQVHNEASNPIYSLAFANATTGVAIAGANTSTSMAWRTTNAGATWQPISFPAGQTNFSMREITKIGTNTLLITGTAGLMLKSTDAGATWTKLEPITGMSLTSAARADDSTTFLVSEQLPLLAKHTPRTALPAPTISRTGPVLSSSAGYHNQWFLNGTPITGASGQSFWAQQNGTYTVQLTQGTCTSPMSAPVQITLSGGLRDPATLPDFKLYPNPAQNYLVIEFNKGAADQEITISDIQGRTVRKMNADHQEKLTIDVKGLSAGIYLVSARSGTAVVHRKVILN